MLSILTSPNVLQAQAGEVLSWQKISATEGNFTEDLDEKDHFGSSVATIGDLNDDGVPEIAVGAPQDDDGYYDAGAVYILFLDSTGLVDSSQKISSTSGGFGGLLHVTDDFGHAVAGVGDVNNDGVPDLAVGSPFDSTGDEGAVYILFLNADGTVDDYQKISDTEGSLGVDLDAKDYFGYSLSATSDWDNNGTMELLIGAPGDDDGPGNPGAIYVVFLATDGTVDSTKKISKTSSSYPPGIWNWSMFGSAVAELGDLDGDGNPEIAVSPATDSDSMLNAGSTCIIFLNSDYTVVKFQKISLWYGDFEGKLSQGDQFGIGLANVGDQNGNGVNDLAVGIPFVDSLSTNCGGVYILLLDSFGKVDSDTLITTFGAGFNEYLESNENFGLSCTGFLDIDNNGTSEFLIGSPGDDDGGSNHGAIRLIWTGRDSSCAGISCGTIEGTMIADFNANCIQDANDGVFPGKKITIRSSNLHRTLFTDSIGKYSLNIPAGNYEISVAIGDDDTLCDTLENVTIIAEETTTENFFQSNHFCEYQIVALGVTWPGSCPQGGKKLGPCPGDFFDVAMGFINTGSCVLNGPTYIRIELDPAMEFISVNQQNCNATPGTLNGPNLFSTTGTSINVIEFPIPTQSGQPCGLKPSFICIGSIHGYICELPNGICNSTAGSSGSYSIKMEVLSVSCNEDSPILIGPCSPCSSNTAPSFVTTLTFPLQCACDPNGKTVAPNGCGVAGYIENDTLHYRIDFENIGAGPATDIFIKDTLDSDLDYTTLVIDTSSHILTDTIFDGYNISFEMDSIMLPGKLFSEPLNKGFIEFYVLPNAILNDHTMIENRASIVFDDMFAIWTNTVTNTIFSDLNMSISLAEPDTIYYGFDPLECDTLESSVGGGVPPFSYSWDPGTIADSFPSLIICPTDTTYYRVVVSDSLGCKTWDQTEVIVIDVHCGLSSDSVIICWDNEEEHCVDSAHVYLLLQQGATLGPCEFEKTDPADSTGFYSNTESRFWISVSPNPFSEILIMKFFSGNDRDFSVKIFDISGKKAADVYQGSITGGTLLELNYDSERLSGGIYFYEITSDGEIAFTRKIMKK